MNNENTPADTSPLAQSLTETGHLPCRKGCSRVFPSVPSRNMHEIRAHGKGWNTSGNFKSRKKPLYPSDSYAYRKRKYEERKAMFRSQGRNSVGKLSAKSRAKISKALKARWAKRKDLTNGVAPATEAPMDNMGEAARAIILTAQVLRSVSLGLKL